MGKNKAVSVKGSKAITPTVKAVKKVVIPTLSKSIALKMDKIERFDNLPIAKKGTFATLLQVSRLCVVSNMGLNKALKEFLYIAKKEGFKFDMLTFNNVREHVQATKYKNLPLFSLNQIALICNDFMKLHNDNVKRSIRAERQSKAVAKK